MVARVVPSSRLRYSDHDWRLDYMWTAQSQKYIHHLHTMLKDTFFTYHKAFSYWWLSYHVYQVSYISHSSHRFSGTTLAVEGVLTSSAVSISSVILSLTPSLSSFSPLMATRMVSLALPVGPECNKRRSVPSITWTSLPVFTFRISINSAENRRMWLPRCANWVALVSQRI